MISERHLYLALEAHREAKPDSLLEEIAMNTIITYAAEKIFEETGSHDEESVTELVQKLAFDHSIDVMINQGLIHEDFDGNLELTEAGKEFAEQNRS